MINRNPEMQIVIESLGASMQQVAAVMALALAIFLIFAILGLTFFIGLMWTCNDVTKGGKMECLGIYTDVQYGFHYSNFDSVMSSVNTLFEVATLNGWTRTMLNAMDTTVVDQGAQHKP